MAFRFYNSNPIQKLTGDCVIRAISTVTNDSWEKIHDDICMKSKEMYDIPSSNQVWGTYLKDRGFKRYVIPNTCPDCYTVIDFCREHPYGAYILATGTHVIAVLNGNYYDTWDSGNEVPIYYFAKER